MLVFFFWVISWFLTWIDDLLVFSSTCKAAKSIRDKAFVILWLLTAVLLMVVLVFFIWQYLKFLERRTFLWFVVPLYLARTIIADKDSDSNWIHYIKKIWMYWAWFLWFAFNCMDDIVYNTAVISNLWIYDRLLFLSWIIMWSIIMICLWLFYSDRVRDIPELRAIVLFLVSIIMVIYWIIHF